MTRAFTKAMVVSGTSLALTACSAFVTDIQQTVEYAISGPEAVNLSAEQVSQLVYATQYVTVGEQARSTVVLGYDDNSRLTWVSATNEALITQHGRVVGSHGLDNPFDNIERPITKTTSEQPDPLACIIQAKPEDCRTKWQATVFTGYGVDQQRYLMHSQLEEKSQQSMTLPNGEQIMAEHWQEQVTTEQAGHSWQFTNHYWLATQPRRIVKSSQQLTPDFPRLTLQELKAYNGRGSQ